MSGIIGQVGARSGVVGSTTDSTQLEYEEGTCTLAWKFGSNVQGVTQDSRYTKIGKVVTVQSRIYLNGAPSGTGNAVIYNFPFATESGSELSPAIRVGYQNVINGDVWLACGASSTEWSMSYRVNSTTSANQPITHSFCGTYAQLRFVAVYYTSS